MAREQFTCSDVIPTCPIAEEKRQNGRILTEKSGLSHMRSLVMVIPSAYFGAQKRRKYAKCVGVNRSGVD